MDCIIGMRLIASTAQDRNCMLCAITITLMLFAHGVVAQESNADSASSAVISELAARYPAGSISSIDMADVILAEASKERAAIEVRFAIEKQACYPEFFVTSCVNRTKERRQKALIQVRLVEIEANVFKRQVRVANREQALAAKASGR